METLQVYILHHKYRLAMVALLCAATLLSFILVRIRLSVNDGTHYSYLFLIRNLFLAWIPLLVAFITESLNTTGKLFRVIFPPGILIWLIFLPNAPYLLTDFQHLRLFSDSPSLWFDVIMVVWCAITGLFLGLVSLYVMHRLARREWGRVVGWIFVFTSAFLSSAGVYIGRFLRFKSLDILQNPSGLVKDLIQQVTTSGSRTLSFVSLYTLFFAFTYIAFYFFGKVLQQDP